jgi:CHASE3 domain sensor protein
MQHRAVRLTLVVLFFAAMTTAAYLFWRGESQAAGDATRAAAFDGAARTVERALVDLRASQRGYVAAGQGGDFWAQKVAQGVEGLKRDTAALRADSLSPAAQANLDRVASALDDFVRVDRRAVEYVRRDQRLLASDVIFADGQELTDAALAALDEARTAELLVRADAVDLAGRRGLFAIAAGAAAALLTVLLLLPSAAGRPAPVVAAERPLSIRPIDARDTEPARVAARAASVEPAASPAPDPVAAMAIDDAPTVDGAIEPMVAADSRANAIETDFAGVASLCADLARVVDTRALPSLLDRAATLLDASGIILWIADPDGNELNPIFAQGYPQQLVNRLGTIPRHAENATAAAFRTSLLQTVRADNISAGAIAAPLVTPGGCVGVMAAEVMRDGERQDMKLAAATIVAAQLATLVGPPTARNHAKTGAAG